MKICFSHSLFGNKLFYYLLLAYKAKNIIYNNINVDLVVYYYEDDDRDKLTKILYQEEIPDIFIWKKAKYPNLDTSGMMWRFYELSNNEYDVVCIQDCDIPFYKVIGLYNVCQDFYNSIYNIGTIIHSTSSTHLYMNGGGTCIKPNYLNLDIKSLMDNNLNQNIKLPYNSDQAFLYKIFNKYYHTDEFVCYAEDYIFKKISEKCNKKSFNFNNTNYKIQKSTKKYLKNNKYILDGINYDIFVIYDFLNPKNPVYNKKKSIFHYDYF